MTNVELQSKISAARAQGVPDEAIFNYLDSQGLIPKDKIVTSTVAPVKPIEPERNPIQKAIGLFLDPIIETSVHAGGAVGDLALTGINKVTGGALDKYTPEGNLASALQRSENMPLTAPVFGTKIKPTSDISVKNTLGQAVSTVALGLGSPAIAGGALGLGSSLENDAGVAETVINTVASAIGGKILEYGFHAVAPYIEKAALKYGQPVIEKLSSYIPESAKGFMTTLSNKISSAVPKVAESNPSFLDRGVSAINKAETAVTKKVEGAVSNTVQGVKNRIAGKTAQQVIATPEAEVAKLSADEQKLWYKNQAQVASQKANDATLAASQASEQSLTNLKGQINDFQQNLGQVNREKAISLKRPAQDLMKESSNKYVELTGEAAEGSTALTKTVNAGDLVAAIDSKFEYNPEVGTALKIELGLNPSPSKIVIDPKTKLPVIQAESPAEKALTNQQILDKAREIMASVSKASKAGGRTYSFAEYQAAQKYSFLMEQLDKNGVDMSKANKFWREWAPTRDRILREIKPFEETNVGKMPITSTIQKSEAKVTTAAQGISKADSQNFIAELESRMKLPKGSIGAETRAALAKVEKAQLAKINAQKLAAEIQKQIKADKAEALKTMSLQKYDTLRKSRVNGIVKKVLIGLGIYATVKVTGLDKALIHIVATVI